jgi:ribonuclease HII
VPPVVRAAKKVAANKTVAKKAIAKKAVKKKAVKKMTAKKKVAAPSKKRAPTRDVENELRADGHAIVVGIDEVGRGAWAGPLMVGAAVVPLDRRVNGIRDSKMLTERERERIFDKVADWCTAWAVGGASHAECDELGMAEAQRLAARRAIEGLGLPVDAAVIDGNWDFLKGVVPHTHMMVKADAYCLSVAAASILAKVTRDRIMRADAEQFPHYAFESNKGYPCPRHKAGLHAHGPSAIHRRSWVFMDALAGPSLRYHRPEQPTLF